MRSFARSSRGRKKIDLNLASMIDVVFLLLIYFMVTMVMSPPEDRLTPTLQTQSPESTGANADFERQIVEVRRLDDGPAYVIAGDVFRDRAGLDARLSTLHRETGLWVQVENGVPVGFAVAAVQAARDAGFDKVTYAPPR